MRKDIRQQLVEWLSTLANDQTWSLLVTITMSRYDQQFKRPWSVTEIDKAICVFVRRLDQQVFPKRHRYEKRRVARIVARHLGAYRDNPHYHIVIARPLHISEQKLRALIIDIAKRIHWIHDDPPHFERYYSVGVIDYLMSDDVAEIVMEATERAC
jgi:hypothetical protein